MVPVLLKALSLLRVPNVLVLVKYVEYAKACWVKW
jgi:hypothetical protein